MTEQMSRKEIINADLVIIGEWGFGGKESGFIVCNPENRDAVRAAYDAIEDGDLSSTVLDGVKSAGGFYVEEA